MQVYVDTSALYAMLDARDARHEAASRLWAELLAIGVELYATNYVLLETGALLQNRVGVTAVRRFFDDIAPVLTVDWVDEPLHSEVVGLLLSVRRRDLSLVDCVSFAAMRRLGIADALAFDAHFEAHGFRCLGCEIG